MNLRGGLVGLGGLSLVAGLWAGAARLGWDLPSAGPVSPPVHGPAMVVGFFGAIISLERSAALKAWWAMLAAPLAVAGALAVTASAQPAAVLLVTGGLVYTAATVTLWRRHGGDHLAVLALGGAAWVGAGILGPSGAAIPWYVGFLVLTIVGERLELSRLAPPTPPKEPTFRIAAAAVVVGLLAGVVWPAVGARILGGGLVALGAWMAAYDIARRTVRRAGKTRFIAVSLLLGQAWLAAGGLMWLLWGDPRGGLRADAQLHAVFLGFVLSMVLGHVYLIAPALLGLDVPFRRWAYAPLGLLHGTLLLRLWADLLGSGDLRRWAGLGNIVAVLGFLAGVAGAVMGSRRKGART